jgi:hypothetical protein
MLSPMCPQTSICRPFSTVVAKKGQMGASRPGVMRNLNTRRANLYNACAQVRKGVVRFLVPPEEPRPNRRRTIPDQHKLGVRLRAPWSWASYLAVNTNVPRIGTSCHEGINTPRFDGASFHATVTTTPGSHVCHAMTINPNKSSTWGSF